MKALLAAALALCSTLASGQGLGFIGQLPLVSTSTGRGSGQAVQVQIVCRNPANTANAACGGSGGTAYFGDELNIHLDGTNTFSMVDTSTGFVTAGKFGDARVGISTGALSGVLPTAKGGTGNATGQAATALALAVTPSSCTTGSFPAGVDVNGNVRSCQVSAGGAPIDYGVSTGALAIRLDKVAVDTTTIGSALTAETSRATTRENAIGTSTQTLATKVAVDTTTIAATELAHEAADAAVFLKVAADTTSINSSLSSEITRATARENAIGTDTGTITASVTAETARATAAEATVGASTRTLANAVALSTTSLASGSATTYVLIKGSTMTGALSMGSNLINLVTDPVSAQDAATKNYVDSNLSGLDFRAPARLGTTAALPANSYDNTAKTITGLSIGLLTIDGATAQVGDRVLINNEGAPSHNGIYTVTTNGTLVLFLLTRATDFDVALEMADGVAIFVDSGTANTATGWVTTSSVTTPGTDPILFVQFSGLGDVTAGSGLTKSGNTMSVDSSSVAVLSGGFVLNSQLDPSSVTKQGFVTLANLTGIVPTNKIDLSTVTTRFSQVAAPTNTQNTTESAHETADTAQFNLVATSTTSLASGGATTYLLVSGANGMTGQFTTQSTITVQGSAFSVGGTSFTVTGGSATVKYSLTAQIYKTTDGSFLNGSLITSTATLNGSAFSVGGSSFTVSGGSTTVGYRLQSGSVLDQGLLVVQGTMTVQGQAFSVGGSSFTVSGGSATVGFGLTAAQITDTGMLTVTSTATLGNIVQSANTGIVWGNSSSTGTFNSTGFFIDSTTAFSQGATTCTQSTAITYFSTFTILPNTFVNRGDEIFLECVYKNGTVLTTPIQGIDLNSGTVLNTLAVTTAQGYTKVKESITLLDANNIFPWQYQSDSMTQAAGASTSSNGSGNGTAVGEKAFVTANSNTLHCYASRAGGGNIEFMWMKVWKR